MHYKRKENEALIPNTIAVDALVVWEVIYDQLRKHPVVDRIWDNTGIWAMRELALELTPYCTVVWKKVTEDGDLDWCFDGSFVPKFLQMLFDTEKVHWDDSGYGQVSFDGLEDHEALYHWAQNHLPRAA